MNALYKAAALVAAAISLALGVVSTAAAAPQGFSGKTCGLVTAADLSAAGIADPCVQGTSPASLLGIEPGPVRAWCGVPWQLLRQGIVVLVPPNFRRYLPFVLIAVFLLFLLPSLLRKKTTTGPSPSTRAGQTIEAMNLIDKREQLYRTAHGRFTPHLADLLSSRLANDLAIGLVVQLDVGTDGQGYLAQVRSDVLSLVRGRTGARLTAQSCLVLASGSGVACPAPIK